MSYRLNYQGGRGEQRWWDPRDPPMESRASSSDGWRESHAYNKGKALVFSKVRLPDCYADLDERHGSTQKEIKMSTETERRVENLLARSKDTSTQSSSTSTFTQEGNQPLSTMSLPKSELTSGFDTLKEKFSAELRELQNSKKAALSARAMNAFSEKLPAYKVKDGFLKAVADNQVLVVSGETGWAKPHSYPNSYWSSCVEQIVV